MADDQNFPQSGFGGGSPDEQANNQPAIPESPEWGQSLGQDVGNVGRAVGNAVSAPLNAVGQTLQSAGRAAGEGIGNIAPRIMSYLSGNGAMDQQQWDGGVAQVDPNGNMDQNEITTRMIDKFGSPALQHARKQYDLYKANAAKELSLGNLAVAAQDATAAHNYMPDGSKTVFAATKDGFTVGVWSPDGQMQKFNLNPAQMNSMLRGEHGLFDTVAEATAPQIIAAAVQGGGLPIQMRQVTPQDVDQGRIPGVKSNTDPRFPGNVPGDMAGSLIGNETDPRSMARSQMTPVGGRQPTPGQRPVWVNNSDGSGTGYWKVPQPEYVNPADRTEPAPGDESPININRRGVNRLEGNASVSSDISPEQRDLARTQAPNNPSGQAAIYGREREAAANRASAERVARGRGAEAAGVRAAATVQSALTRAQAVTSGADTRYNAEQARTAAGILGNAMKGGVPMDQAIQEMQKQKIAPELINHLIQPEQAPQQPQKNATPNMEVRYDAQGRAWTKDATGKVIPFNQGQ